MERTLNACGERHMDIISSFIFRYFLCNKSITPTAMSSGELLSVPVIFEQVSQCLCCSFRCLDRLYWYIDNTYIFAYNCPYLSRAGGEQEKLMHNSEH